MKHVHKYERRKLGSWKTKGADIYKCAIPGCNHYLIGLDTVVGRYSRCWGIVGLSNDGYAIECPNEVEMTRYIVFSEKRKRPICDECKERKRQERDAKKEQQMEEKLDILEKLIGDHTDVKIDYEQ